jgi:hypothetical protein
MISFFKQSPSVLNQAVAYTQIAHISHSRRVLGARKQDSDVLPVEQAEGKSVFFGARSRVPHPLQSMGMQYTANVRRSSNGK